MKLTKSKIKENLNIIATVLAIFAILFGAVPNFVEWVSDIRETPKLDLVVKHTNTHDACVVSIYNYGNKNAVDVTLTVVVTDENGVIWATNSSTNLPVLPKWDGENPIAIQHVLIKFDETIISGLYSVKAFATSSDGTTAESEKTIEIL